MCWNELCTAVCNRFDREQYNQLLRLFFHVKQNELIHQILAHDPKFNTATITSRFIDWLRDDIKAIVLIHRPENLDTASSLALLQEGLTIDLSRKEVKRNEGGANFRVHNTKTYSPSFVSSSATHSPSSSRNSLSYASPEEKRAVESQKSVSMEDKLTALRAYRKAKGLCYKCGMRWNSGHKCSASVSLHVVEEIWQLLHDDGLNREDPSLIEDTDSGEDLMALSVHATQGTDSVRTVRMLGKIKETEVIMLINSDSSHCFISESLASTWPHWKLLSTTMKVRLASGSKLLCTHELEAFPITISGHCFHVNLKILPLQCYDVILGIDWLEQHSPMAVDWREKWLSFDFQGTRIKLQGVRPDTLNYEVISLQEVIQLEQKGELWCALELFPLGADKVVVHCPTEIQQLVEQFAELFEEPKGLPPPRNSTHSIPLIAGAQPFRLRPYRYNPAQKDEIEKQVAKILQNGMIQESVSPFASPVLLVKKKTGDWRLCVDYRRLNAMTIKNKFPLPVVDEILDELSGAKWFTTLDMSSGFHQILMKIQDRYKTAFQTHHGHYEYLVMPYGVTSGPASFQHEMNTMLAPILRKFAVVFIDDILIYSKTWEEHLSHIQQVFEILQHHKFKGEIV